MRFNTKQKIFIILSIALFFVWIGTMTLLTQTEYKGNITNATFTACVGCAAALALYVTIFSGKYRIKTNLSESNSDSVNSDVLNAYIGVLYVDIAGFFMMSCSSLMIAYDQKEVRKFNLVGLAILLTLIALTAVIMTACLKISAKIRRYTLQEQNGTDAEADTDKEKAVQENNSQDNADEKH